MRFSDRWVLGIFREVLFHSFTLGCDDLTMTIRFTVFIVHHKLSGSRVDISRVLRTLILGETSLEIVTVCINSVSVCAIHLSIFHRAGVGVSWTLYDNAISIWQVIIEKSDDHVECRNLNAATMSFPSHSIPLTMVCHRNMFLRSEKTLDLSWPSHFYIIALHLKRAHFEVNFLSEVKLLEFL